MEVEILNGKKRFLEFKIVGERHTFPQLLKHHLLNLSDVDFASYKLSHPSDKESIFVIKTDNKWAKTALKKANKKIRKETREFKRKLKALK